MGTGISNTEESWAVTEFAEADLGDARRTQRLIRVATRVAQQPLASFLPSCDTMTELKPINSERQSPVFYCEPPTLFKAFSADAV